MYIYIFLNEANLKLRKQKKRKNVNGLNFFFLRIK